MKANPDVKITPATVADATDLPQPDKVLGVSECQIGIADLGQTPVVGTAGMSTCTAAVLVDKSSPPGKALIMHVTEPGDIQNANPAIGKFLGVPNADKMAPADLQKAIQDNLASRSPGSLQLVTVAGDEGQARLDGKIPKNTPGQIFDHLASLDSQDAITHVGHAEGRDFMYDTQNDRLYTNTAGVRQEGQTTSFDAADYDWGPYSVPVVASGPAANIGLGGSANSINRAARNDNTPEVLFLVQDNTDPGFEASQRETAAQTLADRAVDRAFANNPSISDERKKEVAKMMADTLKNAPEFKDNRGLQNEVTRSLYADAAAKTTHPKVTSDVKKNLAEQSLLNKLEELAKTSVADGDSKIGQRPGALRQMFDRKHTDAVKQANDGFKNEVEKLVKTHPVEQEPLALANKRDAQALQQSQAPKPKVGDSYQRNSNSNALGHSQSIPVK